MYIQEIRLLVYFDYASAVAFKLLCYDYGSILHPSRFPMDPKKEIHFSLFLAVPGRDI